MLAYLLVYPLLWLISKLPFAALIKLSDAVAWLLESVIRYRHDVVYENLKNAFPDKRDEERAAIAHKFYRHLSDRLFETIKMQSITKAELLNRVSFPEYEKATSLVDRGQSIVAVMGHCGSWEMACLAASAFLPEYSLYSVFTPVANRYFNQYFIQLRSRFGMRLYSMKEMVQHLRRGFGEASIGMYVADQGHSNPDRAYWRQFLHQETNFMTGPARFALAHQSALVFVDIRQTGRMRYAVVPEVLTTTPQLCSETALTDMFVNRLEQQIRQNPADWLWSHKRWKHKKKK
ncbi:MAG: hypothetical protein U0T84_09985 [Chitinophagales bacterium]